VTDRQSKPVKVPAIVNALYTEHYVVMRQFTLKRVHASDIADDVLQELFVKMVARGKFDDIDDVKSYLYRIILNLINDHHRHHIRQDKTASQLEITEDMMTVPGLNPENAAANHQQLEVFSKALAELPDNCREILVMSRFEGLTHPQIANKLNISKSWVEKNIMKALKLCRQKMEGNN